MKKTEKTPPRVMTEEILEQMRKYQDTYIQFDAEKDECVPPEAGIGALRKYDFYKMKIKEKKKNEAGEEFYIFDRPPVGDGWKRDDEAAPAMDGAEVWTIGSTFGTSPYGALRAVYVVQW